MLSRLKRQIRRFPALLAAYALLRRNLSIFYEWRDTYIWRSRRQVPTPYGFKLLAGNYRANRDMQYGTFEPEETALIQKYLNSAEVFVDVGANIGFYTCIACQSHKHVIAVEPQLHNLECLYTNLSANGWQNAEVYPIGLSNQPGLLTLYGASGTGASLVKGWAGYSPRFRQTIPVSTLDILLGERFVGKKLLIKIDVEGAEYAVLRGSSKTIATSPPPTWMIEICLNEYHPTGLNPNYIATFAFFWQNGYQVHTANRENRLINPIDVERWAREGRCDSGVISYIFTSLP